jgi:hypothetical protein
VAAMGGVGGGGRQGDGATMKPCLDGFCVVTATADLTRAATCVRSWRAEGAFDWPLYGVLTGEAAQAYEEDAWRQPPGMAFDGAQLLTWEGYGVVGPFAQGVAAALKDGHQVIACLHDDVEIHAEAWDLRVMNWFAAHPACGVLGFGGGTGLGDADLYQTAYVPVQLARQDFVSNMRDAEIHGRRGRDPERVSCLDGFSQIGRREFWYGHGTSLGTDGLHACGGTEDPNLFQRLYDLGVHHHMYDGALGAYAARFGWETWMLPVACHHLGGVTAVGDPRYADWLATQGTDDAQVWEKSHLACYEEFRDVLPLRVQEAG